MTLAWVLPTAISKLVCHWKNPTLRVSCGIYVFVFSLKTCENVRQVGREERSNNFLLITTTEIYSLNISATIGSLHQGQAMNTKILRWFIA